MSHFLTLVLVDGDITRDEAEDAVEPLLAPYDENGEWFADGSRWDWWVVGGRWTGVLSGYEPREDPVNQERCDLCAGTGRRPMTEAEAEELLVLHGAQDSIIGPRKPKPWNEDTDQDWIDKCNGCNGCHGTGQTLKWEFADHDGDVLPTRNLITAGLPTYEEDGVKKEYVPLALVTPDGKWHEQSRMGWFGATIGDEEGNGEKNEKSWVATVKSLLEQWPDSTAVVTDCHV